MLFTKIQHVAILLSLVATSLFLTQCETEHHDYIYNLKVSTSQPIHVTYKINDEDEIHHKTLSNGEVIRLCKRCDVAGDGIWDIETSASVYKIESFIAYSHDSLSMTENLNRRGYWSSVPEPVGDSAYYTLEITDDCFILDKLNGFTYNATSTVNDTVIITSIAGANIVKDTLVGGHNSTLLGINDIFVYNEHANKKEEEKRIQYLSGLNSITLKLKKNGSDYNRSVNLSKEDSLFVFNEKECTLNIHEWHFDTTQKKRK